jgi:hypothetical protein
VEKRMKLDPSTHKGIFLGYRETSKDYRIVIPVQRKIDVSRDVKFEENLASKRSQESSTVTKDEEQQDLKDEKQPIVQTSSGEEDLPPSNYVKRLKWLL